MNINKDFPVRSQSRAQYAFWITVAVVAVTWGMLQFIRPGGNPFLGLIAILGFTGMAMRETSLRMKAKKWFKVHGCY